MNADEKNVTTDPTLRIDAYVGGYCCEGCKRFFPARRGTDPWWDPDRVAHHGGCFMCGSLNVVRVMVRAIRRKSFGRVFGLRYDTYPLVHWEMSPHAFHNLAEKPGTYHAATPKELGW